MNLSPVQFKNGNLTHIVLSALANAGLPAGRLELEVTESLLLAASETNLATLHRLRALGVSISMDLRHGLFRHELSARLSLRQN
ncbi:MAG: putative signaling protein [Beijerinckiaceae bacterium]|nr:MAG: putative signaling protein [Beijerinckiaceae bacterium]